MNTAPYRMFALLIKLDKPIDADVRNDILYIVLILNGRFAYALEMRQERLVIRKNGFTHDTFQLL